MYVGKIMLQRVRWCVAGLSKPAVWGRYKTERGMLLALERATAGLHGRDAFFWIVREPAAATKEPTP